MVILHTFIVIQDGLLKKIHECLLDKETVLVLEENDGKMSLPTQDECKELLDSSVEELKQLASV